MGSNPIISTSKINRDLMKERNYEEKFVYIINGIKAPLIIIFILFTISFANLNSGVTSVLSAIAGNVVERASSNKKEEDEKQTNE